MADVFSWEEEFAGGDRCTLTKDCAVLGYVEPNGGSWIVVQTCNDNEPSMVAMRPDKESAQRALIQFVEASKAIRTLSFSTSNIARAIDPT